jgi:hypothetical protein
MGDHFHHHWANRPMRKALLDSPSPPIIHSVLLFSILLHSAVLSIYVPHGDANRKAYTRLQGTTRQRMHSIRNVKKTRIHPRSYENNGRFVCEGRGWGRGEGGSGSHGTTAQQRMPTLKPNQTPCLLIPFPAPRYPLTVRCLSNPLLIQRRIRLVHRLFLC